MRAVATSGFQPPSVTLLSRGGLVRKHANAHRGGCLAGIGLACLILGILFGIHISLNVG